MVVLASGTYPELLDTLRKMEHPAYEEWRSKGCSNGNAGVIIYGWKDKFKIIPYNQVG